MSDGRNEAPDVSLDEVAKLLWDVGEPGNGRDDAHNRIDEMSRLLWAISERNADEHTAAPSTFSS
ncbi:hypothetical protein [Microvirga sp. M2]|uniref:hypothetical protein n=1 Tax=Microvirga sp. M2 TaxID=3073270 RepID=UPI0039C2CF7C